MYSIIFMHITCVHFCAAYNDVLEADRRKMQDSTSTVPMSIIYSTSQQQTHSQLPPTNGSSTTSAAANAIASPTAASRSDLFRSAATTSLSVAPPTTATTASAAGAVVPPNTSAGPTAGTAPVGATSVVVQRLASMSGVAHSEVSPTAAASELEPTNNLDVE